MLMVGGLPTVRFAVAMLPVPPLVDVTAAVVLVYCPEVVPVTVTLNVQWSLAAMLAPARMTVAGARVVNAPPHTVEVELATVRPAGRMSVNATPVNAVVLSVGLMMVNVSVVVAFRAMVDGVNTLAIEGGAMTLMLAEAVPPVPPSLEVTALVVSF